MELNDLFISSFFFFFFNDTATTEIYTLSLHDALPIWESLSRRSPRLVDPGARAHLRQALAAGSGVLRADHRRHLDRLRSPGKPVPADAEPAALGPRHVRRHGHGSPLLHSPLRPRLRGSQRCARL